MNLSESVGEHKWICWSSTVAMNIKCIFKRRRRGLSKELSDVPVLGSISKDLNLTQSLKEGQAFIGMESRQDFVSTDKHY
ncbi:hypothetical protein ACROYT_G017725 [Oculina patagonica]